MLGKLRTYRNQILFIELAGLLHDIGKLSKVFLEYRQTWQDDPHGYDNDLMTTHTLKGMRYSKI